MILFIQFADSVIGSRLSPEFQKVRIRITIFAGIVLVLLLFVSGVAITAVSNRGLERVRPESILRQTRNGNQRLIDEEFRQLQDQIRSQNQQEFLQSLYINQILLLVLIISGVWVGLYFLLLPSSQSLQAKQEFVSMASHELLTPLAILYSELSLAAEETDIKQLQQINTQALTEILRLQQLSDRLLGRVRHSDPIGRVNVQSKIQQIWSNLHPLNYTGHQLKIQGRLQLMTTADIFEQLLFNLLHNFIKHNSNTSTLLVELSDNQIRLSNPTKQTDFEVGLGLQIAQQLANDLGYSVQTELRQGNFVVAILINK